MKRSSFHGKHYEDNDHQVKKQMRDSKLADRKSDQNITALDKVLDLKNAINDILEETSLQDVSKILDHDVLSRCEELRKVLATRLQDQSATSSQPAPLETSNIPKALAAMAIKPWKSSEIPNQLPPLPVIKNDVLNDATFTHQGMGGGRLNHLSYERLEWVGDSYLYLTSTLLISQTFPSLLPGKCAHLRELCVRNLTLADYARQYNFKQQVRFPGNLFSGPNASNEKGITKIMGDIFEAYVAAVILSDPENGLTCATDWLKKLWSMTLRKEILEEERKGMMFDSPMWRLRGNEGFVPLPRPEDSDLGPKEKLQKALGLKGIKLTYRDAAPEKKDKIHRLPLFTVGVYLDGYGEKDKQLGFGTGNGKKEAGAKAASMALENKPLMKQLLERKRVREAQMEQERLALEKLGE